MHATYNVHLIPSDLIAHYFDFWSIALVFNSEMNFAGQRFYDKLMVGLLMSLLRYFLKFMEAEESLLYPQHPANYLLPEPDASTQNYHVLLQNFY